MGRRQRRQRANRRLRKKARQLVRVTDQYVRLKDALEGGHEGLADDLEELERLREGNAKLADALRGALELLGDQQAELERLREQRATLDAVKAWWGHARYQIHATNQARRDGDALLVEGDSQ